MHQFGKLDFDDLNWESRRYRRWRAYSDSKLANLLFGKALARRLAATGSPVTSLIAHPGYAETELQGKTETYQDKVMALGTYLISQSAADGAMPTLYAATSAQATNGGFYGPTKRFGMVGPPGPSSYKKIADDEKVQQRLWAASERLTGVTSPIWSVYKRAPLLPSGAGRRRAQREVSRVGAEEPLVLRWRHPLCRRRCRPPTGRRPDRPAAPATPREARSARPTGGRHPSVLPAARSAFSALNRYPPSM